MASKAEERRQNLKAALIDIAERTIAEHGLANLRARDLAKEAGCSVGAIYNVFTDLTGIILAVNGRTFHSLGQHVANSLRGEEGKGPTERLVIMSHAYLDYAAQHPRAWRALFDVRMSTDMDVPQWYLAELERLFAIIALPVREAFPNLSGEDVALMTRALFSSVHGIVLLGLENRISAVPREELKRMISMTLRAATSKM